MSRNILLILSIVLAVIVAYVPAFDFLFGIIRFDELGMLFHHTLKLISFLVCGVALIHSLFWLSYKQSISVLKMGGLLILYFSALVVLISYLIAFLLSLQNEAFSFDLSNPVIKNEQDYLGVLSPVAILSNPITIWFLICVTIAYSLQKVLTNKFQFNTMISLVLRILENGYKWIEIAAPLGIFCLLAVTLNQTSLTFEMALYLLTYLLGEICFIMVLLPIVFKDGISMSRNLLNKLVFYPALFAFGFGDVAVALPIYFSAVNLIPSTLDEKEKNQYTGLLVTLGYLIFPIANFLLILFPLSIFSDVGQGGSIQQQVQYVFASFMVLASPIIAPASSISYLLDVLKLPRSAIGFYIETYAILKHFHAFIQSINISIFIYLFISYRPVNKILHSTKLVLYKAVAWGAVVLLLLGFYFFIPDLYQDLKENYTPVDYLPIENPVPQVPYSKESPTIPPHVRSLKEIQESNILRVGYNTNPAPFVFRNAKGEVVGFDIDVANRIARTLDVKLQLIPLDYKRVVEQMQGGEFDIAMAGLGITENRLKGMNFSDPVIRIEKGLIVRGYEHSRFKKGSSAYNDPNLKVAFLKGSSFEANAKTLFPVAKYVPLENYEEFAQEGVADVLFWTFEQGYLWISKHPIFTFVPIENSDIPIYDYYAYGVAYGSEDLVDYLNLWLQLLSLNNEESKLKKKWKIPQRQFNP